MNNPIAIVILVLVHSRKRLSNLYSFIIIIVILNELCVRRIYFNELPLGKDVAVQGVCKKYVKWKMEINASLLMSCHALLMVVLNCICLQKHTFLLNGEKIHYRLHITHNLLNFSYNYNILPKGRALLPWAELIAEIEDGNSNFFHYRVLWDE
jgi:hypothetical protein